MLRFHWYTPPPNCYLVSNMLQRPCKAVQGHGKLMFRDLTGEGTSGPVSKYVVDLEYQHGAGSLFKFLVSVDGLEIIDPDSDLASTRTNPCQRHVPPANCILTHDERVT